MAEPNPPPAAVYGHHVWRDEREARRHQRWQRLRRAGDLLALIGFTLARVARNRVECPPEMVSVLRTGASTRPPPAAD